ncbi:MAG: RNA polymerase sigma factor (sigma-70 family) [Cyclobacteriaceae bacterium]|jgi:RNA polymerase sigma factor (sigma-70 family)
MVDRVDSLDASASDIELITLIQEGQLRFFDVLGQRYRAHIFSKCFSYVKQRESAADLTQDILIKVYLELPTFRKEARFSTWLYAIIHNICIDFLRRNKKNIHQVLTAKLAESVVDDWIEEETLAEEKTLELMEALLLELSPEDKLILVMKYKEKHSIKDIVQVMHLSESAVKMRLKRAKERLNEFYRLKKA